jgi:hypothetical protein
MNVTKIEEFEYVPPKMEILETSDIMTKLGPVVSCSGFGGAVTGGC